MNRLALGLLVVGMWCYYGWRLFDVDIEVQGAAWNVGQQAVLLLLLCAVALLSKSVRVMLVCGLLSVYSLAVVVCETWWLMAPWPRIAGEGSCSTRLHVPLGILGLALGCMLLAALVRRRG